MKSRTAIGVISAGLAIAAVLATSATALAAKSATSAKPGTASTASVPKGAPPQGMREGRGPRGGMGGREVVDVISKLTGESTSTIKAARDSGTSFAQIASAKGVTEAQIVELTSHAPKAAMASRVADGLMTQAEADRDLAELGSRLTQALSATAQGGPEGHGPGGSRDGRPPAGSTPPTTAPAPQGLNR